MSQLAVKSEQVTELESQIRNHNENSKMSGIERDSLEFENDKKQTNNQLNTQLKTLQTEHEFLKGRLEHLNNDFETIVNKVYQKKYDSFIYRAGPLMDAIIFMSGTKYDCNDCYYGN